MYGLNCCDGVAEAKTQCSVGIANRFDVHIPFEAFSYRSEAAGPGEFGSSMAVFREVVLGEARLDVGVAEVLEFWDETLGAGEVDDEV